VTKSEDQEESEEPVASRALARRRGRWAVRIHGPDGDTEHTATDLSAGGLFLAGGLRAVGERLRLTVALADGPLSTDATVRWARGTRSSPLHMRGFGVAFDELDEATRARITAELDPDRPR
jgi:hypothetical protein